MPGTDAPRPGFHAPPDCRRFPGRQADALGLAGSGVAAVALVSSDSSPADLEALRGRGTPLATKPLRQAAFAATIADALPRRAAQGASLTEPRRVERQPGPATRISAAASLRVLLAEDHAVNQRVAVAMLSKRGHVVHVVDNGRDAVEAVAAQRFDVVLMDVQMPIMNGFEATATIRVHEAPGPRTAAGRGIGPSRVNSSDPTWVKVRSDLIDNRTWRRLR